MLHWIEGTNCRVLQFRNQALDERIRMQCHTLDASTEPAEWEWLTSK